MKKLMLLGDEAIAQGALDAPGMDAISHPSMRMNARARSGLGLDLYGALYAAANGYVDASGHGHIGMKDEDALAAPLRIPHILIAVSEIMARCSHLENYRHLEAADSAYDLYVNRGTPHWKKRKGHWQDWAFHNPPEPEDYYR